MPRAGEKGMCCAAGPEEVYGVIVCGGLILRKLPPSPAIFFNGRFKDARHEEGCSETYISMYFPVLRRTIER